MTRFLIALLVLSVSGFAVGCSGSGDAGSEDTATNETPVADMAKDAVNSALDAAPLHVEMACGSCIYKIEGVTACSPAVKIGEKAMQLTGVEVDAHGLGLCAAPKHAHVKGQIEDGKFVASAVEMAEH